MKKVLTAIFLSSLSCTTFAEQTLINHINFIQVEAVNGSATAQQVTITYNDESNNELGAYMSYCTPGTVYELEATCIRNFDVFKSSLSMLLMAKSTNQKVYLDIVPGFWGTPTVKSVAISD